MYTHVVPFSLYIPPAGHQEAAPESKPQQPPPPPPPPPQQQQQQSQPQSEYRRSRSATDRFAFFRRAASAGPSQSEPRKMSATASSTSLAANLSPRSGTDLNTLPDPRGSSPRSSPGTPSETQRHPDLSNEVAALSAKLINAINHQTNLDDSLQETRHELEQARQRIVQLEREAQEHREALSQGLLVRRTDSAQTEERMQNVINEERRKRNSAEREKKGMELELENLTSQLFEEANRMVAAARKEREVADKRADQLKAQLKDTETLLSSQQDQLSELKSVLQDVQTTPTEIVTTAATAPASPTSDKVSSKTFDYPTHQRNAHSMQSLPPPESPLHFSNLIHPVVRVDHQAYEDFISLLRSHRNSGGRASSGSYVGLNVLGIGSKDSRDSQVTLSNTAEGGPANSSRSASSQSVPTQGQHSPHPSTDSASGQSISLKETRYFKRALVEDIEPTLRLDTAPALSWLARRTVINSITGGKLIIEPYPPRHAFHSPAYACALCGEVRTNEQHLRRFRFRTSDSDDVQRYPLCDYCLSRVRTACDFTTFLREAQKGNMRNETPQECRIAWEECIRLRERMFWSRIGGGVIPAPNLDPNFRVDSPSRKPSVESERGSNATRVSRSESDVRSVRRADSGLSTGSEPSPLSEAMTRDGLPDMDESEKLSSPMEDLSASDAIDAAEERPAREEHPLAQVLSATDEDDNPMDQAQAGSTPESATPATTPAESASGPVKAVATLSRPALEASHSQSSITTSGSVASPEFTTPAASPSRRANASPAPKREAPQPDDEIPKSPSKSEDATLSDASSSPNTLKSPISPTALTSPLPRSRPTSLLSPTRASTSADSPPATATFDPTKQQQPPSSPLRSSKVASLASRFAELDAPRAPRPLSTHSLGAGAAGLRSETNSPARRSFDVARGRGSGSASPERRSPVREGGTVVPGSSWQ